MKIDNLNAHIHQADEARSFPRRDGQHIELLVNGCEIFPAMLDEIRGAQQSISFETFIYWSGDIAEEFAAALAARAEAGVVVRVVLDWLGCRKMDDQLVDLLRRSGVEVIHHRPLRWFHFLRANHRSHRKLLIIDGCVGFLGGVGIAEKWTGDAGDPDHWRDNHYRIRGPVVADMQRLFFTHWRDEDIPADDDPRYYPPLEPAGDVPVRLIGSEPIDGPNRIEELYLEMLSRARRHFLLTAPYFAPGERLLTALCDAARRGVTVEVVTAGIHHDRKVVRKASRHDWGRLFKAGVRIFEYHRTLIHTKLVIQDDDLTLIGSANFDPRSTRLNDEANLLIEDGRLAQEHEERSFRIDRDFAHEVRREEWERRPIHRRIIDAAAHLLRPQV